MGDRRNGNYITAYNSYRRKRIALVIACALFLVGAATAFLLLKPAASEAVAAPVTRSYIASHAPEEVSSLDLSKIEPSGEYLHVKYTLAFEDKVEDGETIESMYASYDSAMSKLIGQVDGTAALYTVPGLDDAYIAFTDSTRNNGLSGKVLDVAFAWDDLDGHDVEGIEYDEETGIALVPKSVIEDAGSKGIQQQVLLAVDLDDLGTSTAVSIEGERAGLAVPSRSFDAYGTAFSMELDIPVATQPTAGAIDLGCLGVELNDTPVQLVEGRNAAYDPATGVLHLAYSPLGISEVKVSVAHEGAFEPERAYAESVLDWTTMHIYNDGYTYFDELDLDSLERGDLLVYDGWTKMYGYHVPIGTGDQGYSSDDMSGYDSGPGAHIITGDVDGWNEIPYYQTWLLVNDVAGEVTFAASSPFNKTATKYGTSETYSLHAVNADDEVIAMTCSHVTSPLGLDPAYGEGDYPIGMRILEKTDRVVVVGYVTYELGYQTGCAVYKYAVQSKGGINLTKESANPSITDGNACYSLENAVYGVYANADDAAADKNRVSTLKTDADGKAQTGSVLHAGTYYVKELQVPTDKDGKATGYALDPEIHEAEVTAGRSLELVLKDLPQDDPAAMWVGKIDYETTMTWPEGSASLAGAEFTIKYYDGYYDTADSLPEIATRTWVVATDKDGYARLSKDFLINGNALYETPEGQVVIPLGTITVQETKAPEGYFLEDAQTGGAPSLYLMKITALDQAVEVETYNPPVVLERVHRGNIELQKNDADLGTNRAQGAATLGGAVYEVVNANENPVYSPQYLADVAPGGVVCTITTDEKGHASTTASAVNGWEIPDGWDGSALAVGSYTIRERTASEGYLVNEDWHPTVTISEDKEMVDAGTTSEKVKRGGVRTAKYARENGTYKAEGTATLEGAQFTITTNNDQVVVVGGTVYAKNEAVAIIQTAYDGDGRAVAQTLAEVLPYGNYTVKETKTSPGYCLDEESLDWSLTFDVTENGVVYDYSDLANAAGNRVQRSDLALVKVKEPGMERMANVAFEVTSSTGERHVMVTDVNGEIDTSSANVSHARKTNANDAALNPDGTIDESKLDPASGIWFNGRTDVEAAVNDKVGALPYDTYHVREIPAKATTGVQTVEFDLTVYRDGVVIDAGTVDDLKVLLETELVSGINEHVVHEGLADTFTESIHIDNLKPDKTYRLVSELHEFDADGKDLGIVEKKENAEFKAAKTSITYRVNFNVDTTGKAGHRYVAYERLYDGAILLASETDPGNEMQTVHVPSIKTYLGNGAAGKEIPAQGPYYIVDTVSYAGLEPHVTYQVSGTLHVVDPETGADKGILKDKDGNNVTCYETFAPDSTSGTVDAAFDFDAADLEGGKLVAYETIIRSGNIVAEHADPADGAQTVIIPTIKTDLQYGSYKAAPAKKELVLVDTVTYGGFTPGETYTVASELHRVGADGVDKGIIDSKEAVIEAKSIAGTAEIKYTVDATGFEGDRVVCTERLIHGRTVLVEHTDLANERETVTFPTLKTTATDGESKSHSGRATNEATIEDVVEFTNLPVGVEATLTATVHLLEADGTDLGAIEGVSASTSFTPSKPEGKALVTIPLDTSKYEGKKVVVLEQLTYGSETFAQHADLGDEDQMVTYATIATWAHSKLNGTHVVREAKGVSVVDTVYYWGLNPEETYTLTATLHARDDGDADAGLFAPVTGLSTVGFTSFKPDGPNGQVDVPISFDSEGAAGAKFTVYETLAANGVTIATDADIDAPDEYVNVAGITTEASDASTGKHEGFVGKDVTIADVVKYKGLDPGEAYKVEGVLMDYATKEPYKDKGGRTVTASSEFTAEKTDGSTTVNFEFNGENLDGKTLIAYEKLYDSQGNLLCSHEVIDSYDQSVTFHYTPEEAATRGMPTTGDMLLRHWWVFAIAIGVGIAGVVAALIMRRRYH